MEVPIPPVPTFDEDISSVEERVRKLVGKIHCPRKFEPVHPLVAKLLAHDEERRRDFAKWGSNYYAPRYDSGIERRRLLIINALFLAAVRLGCRPSMSTSKYGQEPGSERDISITIGESHLSFTIEQIKSRKAGKRERLQLAFGTSRSQSTAERVWIDSEEGALEIQVSQILVEMLVGAERSYRNGLIRHREWVIERRAEAETELKRRKEEAERKERELRQKLARERIGKLLSQAKALDRASQIRAYIDSVLGRITELQIPRGDLDEWVTWARQVADSINPVVNGTVVRAVQEHAEQE